MLPSFTEPSNPNEGVRVDADEAPFVQSQAFVESARDADERRSRESSSRRDS